MTPIAHEAAHAGCVRAWWMRAADGRAPAEVVQAFERAFDSVWRRAQPTLGDVTLTAILDRVLYTASEQFTSVASLKVGPNGLSCDGLRACAGDAARDELGDGIRFVLIEFLTVLGNLTAEILTPALHAELAKVGTEGDASGGKS